jgi:hypothetical protein
MIEKHFPIENNNEQEYLLLKAKIKTLQEELAIVEQKIAAFEAILRNHLENELIEERELTVLYKKLQQQKKEKRLAQKQRGKNYVEKQGLKVVNKTAISNLSNDEKNEKKRLYREAMLQVHPDKFSMNHEKIDLATEITTKLIEIYQTGDLNDLKKFYSHIFIDKTIDNDKNLTLEKTALIADNYLKNELKKTIKQLEVAKAKHTYKVLIEYQNPLTFINELKDFYNDRIFKLKKRTRKAK